MKRILIFLFGIISLSGKCQLTPAPNATLLADSLVFGGAVAITHATLTYNPLLNKYYSIRIGNLSYPLQTWNQTGGMPIFQDTAGIDTRGIWWNPNTSKVERNCFNALGWATLNLDGSGNATHNYTTLFTGQHQPTTQSVGAYDYKTNTVIFNSSGTISIYDRNTGTLTSTVALTGTSLTNINTESVIYTGQTGYEIGILDWSAKRVLLFNRATGIFSGMSQLPATAVTHNQFRFCYANNKVWLFNSSLKKWNSYNIWGSPLPVSLVSFASTLKNKSEVLCNWTTASEVNNDFFTLEKSKDGNEFEKAGIVKGAGNSTAILDYSFTDEHPLTGVSYYRLKQTDFNGTFTYSQIVAVTINKYKTDVLVYPNPAREHFNVSFSAGENEKYSIMLFDITGRIVFSQTDEGLKDGNAIDVNTSALSRGIYSMQFVMDEKADQQKIVLE